MKTPLLILIGVIAGAVLAVIGGAVLMFADFLMHGSWIG